MSVPRTSRDRFAVIGNPIQQSKSPFIHARFAASLGMTIDYGTILAPIGGFAAAVDRFRAEGGRGLNVTAPFKFDAFAYANERSRDAAMAGAANALKFSGERIYAENFDGVGLIRDVVHNLGYPLRQRRVLLIGAGGAAHNVLLPLLAEQPAELVIANRTQSRAVELARAAGAADRVHASSFADLRHERFDVVLNATSASMTGEALPISNQVFSPGGLAYELAYGKGLTPFLSQARAAGVGRLADGVGMLVEQAAESFQWWFGVRPPVEEVMRALTVPLL